MNFSKLSDVEVALEWLAARDADAVRAVWLLAEAKARGNRRMAKAFLDLTTPAASTVAP